MGRKMGGSFKRECQAGDDKRHSSIPRSGRCPGRGHDNLLQIPAWRIPMDRGACGLLSKSWTRLKWLSTHTDYWEVLLKIWTSFSQPSIIWSLLDVYVLSLHQSPPQSPPTESECMNCWFSSTVDNIDFLFLMVLILTLPFDIYGKWNLESN